MAGIGTEEYYLSMMQAWYFATALAKQYEAALPYIEQRRLEPWTHRRAIQKAVESRRVSEERKAYLAENAAAHNKLVFPFAYSEI